MKNKILLALLKQLFEHVIVPFARDYVNRTDNEWDNKALDFLIELEKYILLKLDSDN